MLESAIKSCWREIKEVVVMRATAYEASCMSILGRCIQGMIGNARCSLKRRSKIDRQNEKAPFKFPLPFLILTCNASFRNYNRFNVQ